MTSVNTFITSYELWLIISLVHCGLLIEDIVACKTAKCFVMRKKVQRPKTFSVLFLCMEKALLETAIY